MVRKNLEPENGDLSTRNREACNPFAAAARVNIAARSWSAEAIVNTEGGTQVPVAAVTAWNTASCNCRREAAMALRERRTEARRL